MKAKNTVRHTARPKGLKALFERFYVERQFYLRESGAVRFIALAPRLQAVLAVGLLVLLVWVAYTSMLALVQWRAVWTSHKNLVDVQSAYEERISTLQESGDAREARFVLARAQFQTTIRDLEERHKQLLAFLRERTRVGETMEERRSTANKERNAETKPKPQSYMFPNADTDMSRLASRPPGRKGSAVFATPARHLSLDPAHADRDFRYIFTRTQDSDIDTIPARLARLDTEQRALLAHIDEDVSRHIADYEHIIRTTEAIDFEVFVNNIAEAAEAAEAAETSGMTGNDTGTGPTPRALGGPFVPLVENTEGEAQSAAETQTAALISRPGYHTAPDTRNAAAPPTRNATYLEARHAHLKALDRILAKIPLASPLDSYYISSPFGPRIDPFTQRRALHGGLDLTTQKNSPIHAPLPGRVLFTGSRRGFGKTIEIDHGHGIMTRYAHLKHIRVKKGERVVFRQKIGVIGSSGRSTAEHLHYEILVNGKAYDPWKFLEAGKHVFETKNQ